EWVDWLPNIKILQKTIIQDEEGNLLAVRRSESKPMQRQGKWDFPGGGISQEELEKEDDNIHQKSLEREVKEETNLDIEQIKIIYVFSLKKISKEVGNILTIGLVYKSRVKGIKPRVNLSDEHIEYRWCQKEELQSLDFGSNLILESVQNI